MSEGERVVRERDGLTGITEKWRRRAPAKDTPGPEDGRSLRASKAEGWTICPRAIQFNT